MTRRYASRRLPQRREFVLEFDLPVWTPTRELTVEKNVRTAHAERPKRQADDVELLIGERPRLRVRRG